MFEFLSANLPTIIVALIVFAAFGGAVAKIIHDKRNHKSSCGSCCNCPSAGMCHYRKD